MEFRSDFTNRLIQHMGGDEHVLAAMLVSTQGVESEELLAMDPAEQKGRLKFLMKGRHGTPFEHNAMTFLVEAPIFVFREWHRHRIGVSYNEMSGRYTQLPDTYYIPPAHRPLKQVGKPGAYTYVPFDKDEIDQYAWLFDDMVEEARDNYRRYERRLERGIAKEVARMSLGVNIYSAMYFTCNARSLMAMLSLRTRVENLNRQAAVDKRLDPGFPASEIIEWGGDGFPDAMFPSGPMWEIEQCALEMEAQFAQVMPITRTLFRVLGSVSP